MAESQGDSTTSASEYAAAAAAAPLEGATGSYQVKFTDQHIVNNSSNNTYARALYSE